MSLTNSRLVQFLESFATKHISSSEDRLEETKRKKLAIKAQKMVELMMVSGIGTSSGFEERIRFSEIDIVDSNAIDTGVMHTIPEGNYINGWDVNVAAVRTIYVKRNIRQHKHSEFILRVKKKGELEHFVARRYGDFARLHKRIRTELPGRALPALPKKNKSSSTASSIFSSWSATGDSDDGASLSTVSTRMTNLSVNPDGPSSRLTPPGHNRSASLRSVQSNSKNGNGNGLSPRQSDDGRLMPAASAPDGPANGDVSTALATDLFFVLVLTYLDHCSGTRKAENLSALVYSIHASQPPGCQHCRHGKLFDLGPNHAHGRGRRRYPTPKGHG